MAKITQITSIYDLSEDVFSLYFNTLIERGIRVQPVPSYLLNNAQLKDPPYEIWASGEDVVRFSNSDAAYVYAINKHILRG